MKGWRCMHTTLSVKALVIMGKVESTSNFQATSASLDGASNTPFEKIRSHMQNYFCCYQHKASRLLCNKHLACNGGTSNLILHLEKISIQYQGHGQEWGCQANTQVRATQDLAEPNWVQSILQHNISRFLSGWPWLNMTPISIICNRSLKELHNSLNLPSFSRETAVTTMQGWNSFLGLCHTE